MAIRFLFSDDSEFDRNINFAAPSDSVEKCVGNHLGSHRCIHGPAVARVGSTILLRAIHGTSRNTPSLTAHVAHTMASKPLISFNCRSYPSWASPRTVSRSPQRVSRRCSYCGFSAQRAGSSIGKGGQLRDAVPMNQSWATGGETRLPDQVVSATL